MRRLLAGVAVATAVLGFLPARSSGQAADQGYDFFTVSALADGVTTRFSVKGFLAVEDFVGLSSVSAEARLENSRSTALAVLPDPGDLILALPGTLAGLAGIPGIPDYPAAARADHPFTPREEKTLAPDAGLGAVRLLAEADEPHALGRAAVTDLVDTVGLLPGFSVGSIRSESVTRRIDPLTYEARATTTTNDVRLLGGLFRIGQLTTLVTARVENGKVTAKTEETRISGAEVAGQAVGIDAGGLTSPNGSQALQPVVDSLAAPLRESGISVTLTPGEVTQSDGVAHAASGTVQIELKTVLQGSYPATLQISLGRSTADVSAGGVVEDGIATEPIDTGSDLAPLGGSTVDDGPAGVLGTNLETPADVAAAPTVDTTGAAADARPVAALTDLMDFRALYRLMALAALAVLAARQWTLAQARRRPAAPRPDLRTKWRW